MITLLVGTNTYAAREFLDGLSKKYDQHALSRKDGDDLAVENLPELFQGASLFADERMVILKKASSNKTVWAELAEWLDKIPEEVHLVLIESSPDKRTKTYKALQKVAEVKELNELNEFEAAKWVVDFSSKQGKAMSQSEASYLVDKIGADQWQLRHAIEKLLLLKDTSKERIDEVIEPAPQANVFALIDAALQGRKGSISEQIKILETQEDPYRLFGLLSSQVFQLAAISRAKDVSIEQMAKDLKVHPYPLKKLKPLANKLGKREVSNIVDRVAELDIQLKTSAGEPWLLLERTLIKIAN
ncbi:DNA polymerase III subunit delta [Candidatus Saccharibacteria bacterium]|nr:DNA polymerase III subunit delta [Candidatus Saccharibacteria bacterium]